MCKSLFLHIKTIKSQLSTLVLFSNRFSIGRQLLCFMSCCIIKTSSIFPLLKYISLIELDSSCSLTHKQPFFSFAFRLWWMLLLKSDKLLLVITVSFVSHSLLKNQSLILILRINGSIKGFHKNALFLSYINFSQSIFALSIFLCQIRLNFCGL